MKKSVHALRRAHERVVFWSAALRDVEVDDRIGVARSAVYAEIGGQTDRVEEATPQMRG